MFASTGRFVAPFSLCPLGAIGLVALCAAVWPPSAKAFAQRQQRTTIPLVQIEGPQQQRSSDQIVPTHFRPSSIAFLCAQSFSPPPQMAQMCADLNGIVLLPSANEDNDDGLRRPILIGSEGIGIGTQRKRHFWSGRIAALEGRSVNGVGGQNEGETAAKRGYDYIRFGRRSPPDAQHLAKQQRKKSADSGGARSAYDYIRFG